MRIAVLVVVNPVPQPRQVEVLCGCVRCKGYVKSLSLEFAAHYSPFADFLIIVFRGEHFDPPPHHPLGRRANVFSSQPVSSPIRAVSMPPKPPPRPEGAKAGVPTTAKMPAKRPIGPKAPRRPVNPAPNASSSAAGPSKPRTSLGAVKPKAGGVGSKRGDVKPDLAALERAEEERIRAAEAEWNELIRGGVGNFMDGEGKRIGDKLAAKSVKTVQVRIAMGAGRG